MAEIRTLHDMFVHELRDIYDAERQITKALPRMAKAAGSADLREALEKHHGQTENQIARLEQAFNLLGMEPRGKKCDGIAGIITEGKHVMENGASGPVLDAALIGEAQRVEHYEMAAYGTMASWARAMGHDRVADLLEETLAEEKAADSLLTELAEGGINEAAMAGVGQEAPGRAEARH